LVLQKELKKEQELFVFQVHGKFAKTHEERSRKLRGCMSFLKEDFH
jgi:hypothetical protein